MNECLRLPRPDKHIRLAWKCVNEGVVFNDGFTSDVSSASSLLTEVKWLCSMKEPIFRYLATQSYHIFENLQNSKDYDLETLFSKSQEYRAVLAECEDQLTIEIQNLESNDQIDDKFAFLTSQCNIIKDHQLLWHLAEILFIKSSKAGYLVQDLKGFLSLQQPNVLLNFNCLMDLYNNGGVRDIAIEENDRFWITVLSLALHGRNAELVNLLSCHSHSNSQTFRSIRDILDIMPVFGVEITNHFEFDIAWKKWHRSVQETIIDSSIVNAYPELVLLSKIMIGDKDVFIKGPGVELSDGCWFNAFISFLIYSCPLASTKDVKQRYKQFKKDFITSIEYSKIPEVEVLSEAFLKSVDSLFGLDIGDFILTIAKNNNNWWLLAHLIDIIDKLHPHLFPQPLPPKNSEIFTAERFDTDVCSIREYFIRQYALDFTTHSGLTLLALSYLHYCPVSGGACIEQIVDRLYLPSDRVACMVHSWCSKRGYDSPCISICKRRSVQYFKAGQLGNSLFWAAKANDVSFISRIADRLLRNLFTNSSDININNCAELIDCVNGIDLDIVIGKKLMFVSKFHEIRSLVADGEQKRAAHLFGQLMRCQLLSSKYSLDVLRSMESLLNGTGLFTSEDLHVLMEMVEDVTRTGGDNSDKAADYKKMLLKEFASVLLK